MRNRLNGDIFRKMVLSGLNNLINHEKEVNGMNVFPVADGDTGTNMRLTLENGYKKATPNTHLGLYLKELSSGMLLGARGNSGVILSQLFKGFYLSLARDSIADPREIRDALIRAYKNAYTAVIKPVEGTILTVAREGIEKIKTQISNDIPYHRVFDLYLAEMRRSLQTTPDLLPILKDAGVLDRGGYGYILILEGMCKSLAGDDVSSTYVEAEITPEVKKEVFFDENSSFEQGYCMEFLLQLLNEKNYKKKFHFDGFVESLKTKGNSLVVLQEGTIIKVHIHTLNPSPIINLAREVGEFVSFKLENMQLQHNEYIKNKKEKLPHKNLAIIAVVDGEGVEELYKSMGVDIIIQGGQTMNPSSEQFVDALERIDADKVVIFQNNDNVIETANQAASMMKQLDVAIIPTKTVLEGYYALAMDLPDSDNETRVKEMINGSQGIISITISKAVKDFKNDDFSCSVGDIIGTVNGEMAASSNDLLEAIKNTLEKVEDLQNKSGLIVFLGKNAPEDLQNLLEDLIWDNYPNLEMQCFDGGENVFHAIIGVI